VSVEQRFAQRWPGILRRVPELKRDRDEALNIVKFLADDEVDKVSARGKRKEKMEKVVDRARRLVAAINDLDPGDIDHLEMEMVRMMTDHVIAAMNREMPPPPPPPSDPDHRKGRGGSPQAKVDQYHRDKAAGFAFYLLGENGVRPTLSHGGVWPWLSGVLFEIAFGRPGGDMFAVCLRSDHRASQFDHRD
jgi:hypothetical protein